MKKIIYSVLISSFVCLLAATAFAFPGPIAQSSEWEATGFNNGRHIVRDSNGYFHAFFHSQANWAAPPSGTGCDIFYIHTTVPAIEPPSMANQGLWTNPINLTANLKNLDNRYASVAIEYEVWDNAWQNYNTIHVVWQAILPGGTRYEVLYASVPVPNPPGAVAPWAAAVNLSNTATDSLVPAIDINQHDLIVHPPVVAPPPGAALNQHLHVVWQEEDFNPGGLPNPAEDGWYSEILYRKSVDSGLTWRPVRNLTNTPRNSQMPSIACALDQHSGSPGPIPHRWIVNDFGYNSDDVHVSYNENINGGIHVLYLRSTDDGVTWNPAVDISAITGGDLEAYSNIAVDMLDNPHIVFMRKNMLQREPLRSVAPTYLPGINPGQWRSFPGPDIGMYGVRTNEIVYVYNNGGGWVVNIWGGGEREFPTVTLDRWQHARVNWQEFNAGDYEIVVCLNNNLNPPAWPLTLQNYMGWGAVVNDSNDPANDDLFPNQAFKKVAMYMCPNEPNGVGFDEIWTKVTGHGPPAATAGNPKTIMQDGNMQWGP